MKFKKFILLFGILFGLSIENNIFAQEKITLEKQLEILDLSKSNLSEIKSRSFEDGNKEYKTFLINKGSNQKIILDKNNKIVKLNQISNLDKNIVKRDYLAPESNIEKTIQNLLDTNIIDSTNYKLYSKNLLLDDVWEYIFIPKLEVVNTFNSVKVGIDASTSSVLYINKSKDYVVKENYLDNMISKETAIDIASKIFNTNENLETELKVFDTTPDKENSEKVYVIAYIIKNKNGNRIVIDAYNSNIVYKDKTEGRKDGKAFYLTDNWWDGFWGKNYRHGRAKMLNNIMGYLGYNTSVKYLERSNKSVQEMKDYIK